MTELIPDTYVPRSRAEAAEAKVAELTVALRHEREQHEQTESEVRTEQARVAELEEIADAIQRESDENFARLQQATEALRDWIAASEGIAPFNEAKANRRWYEARNKARSALATLEEKDQ